MSEPRRGLRHRRREQGFTQEALADSIGVATSTYQQWERGICSPRVGFRPALARRLDVSLAEIDRMLDGADGAAVADGVGVPEWLGHLASLEQGAAQLWAFEPMVVHGLLQTRAYATAVEQVAPTYVRDADVVRKVDARLARQRVLDREPEPLALSVVLDESVLLRPAGDRTVMAAQLEHLVAVAGRAQVDVRILPLDAGDFSAAFGSFMIFGSLSARGPYTACVLDRTGPRFIDRGHDLVAHVELFKYLVGISLSPEASADRIRAVIQERYR